MNLVFDCERMKYPYTGLFEYCVQLGKALQALKNADNTIQYYIPKQYQGYFGEDYTYIKQNSLHKLFHFYKASPQTIWHTTYQSSAYTKGGGRKVKRVLTLHDLNFLYEKRDSAKIKKYLGVVQRNVDNADVIIAISNYAKADALAHLNLKNKPISVIYNGCNVLEFPLYTTPVYQPLKPFLFSLGTVLPKKNFHVLPRLLVGNDYELLIAGKGNGDYVAKVYDEAKHFGVERRVKLLGAVSAEDKYWYLKNCAAFLFPSLAEGFGIPPIEAMHFGKPVFLSTATSLPEIGGEHAYYFNNFDAEAMQQMFEMGMKDYVQRNPQELIIKHADSFSWEKSAKQYWDVYLSLK